MTAIAVASASGAPGATVVSLLLGMGWGEPLTVVELSSSGGTAAGLCGLRWQPGVVDLAAAAAPEGAVSEATMARYCQHAPSGVPIVVGAPDPVRAAGASRTLGPLLAAAMPSLSGTLIVDCGRIGPAGGLGSELLPVVSQADVVLVVVRDGQPGETAARVSHARSTAAGITDHAAGRVGIVVVGPGDGREVGAQLPFPFVGAVPLRAEIPAAAATGIPVKDRAGVGKVVARLADRTRRLAASARAGVLPESSSNEVRS